MTLISGNKRERERRKQIDLRKSTYNFFYHSISLFERRCEFESSHTFFFILLTIREQKLNIRFKMRHHVHICVHVYV